MKVIEKQVYIVGFRKTDNDEWETSGQTYGNLIDAQATASGLNKSISGQVKVFIFDRAREVTNVNLNYKDIDR